VAATSKLLFDEEEEENDDDDDDMDVSLFCSSITSTSNL
jgi:hypothetical protein